MAVGYMSGFGAAHASEAVAGALPVGHPRGSCRSGPSLRSLPGGEQGRCHKDMTIAAIDRAYGYLPPLSIVRHAAGARPGRRH